MNTDPPDPAERPCEGGLERAQLQEIRHRGPVCIRGTTLLGAFTSKERAAYLELQDRFGAPAEKGALEPRQLNGEDRAAMFRKLRGVR